MFFHLSCRVIENYDMVLLTFSNDFDKIVNVNFGIKKVLKGTVSETKIENLKFQFINNDWKLIEIKNGE